MDLEHLGTVATEQHHPAARPQPALAERSSECVGPVGQLGPTQRSAPVDHRGAGATCTHGIREDPHGRDATATPTDRAPPVRRKVRIAGASPGCPRHRHR
jgi:hypothetical protein